MRPLPACSSARAGRVSRRLEDLGVDLGQHAAVGDRQREHAGRGPEAECAHEHQRPHDFGHGAQHHRAAGARRGAPPGRASARRPGPMREIDSDRVATKASGTASTKASAMPAVAMASVSQRRARAGAPGNPRAVAGGRKPARKPPITRRLAGSNSACGLNSASTQHRPQQHQRGEQRSRGAGARADRALRADSAQRSSAERRRHGGGVALRYRSRLARWVGSTPPSLA